MVGCWGNQRSLNVLVELVQENNYNKKKSSRISSCFWKEPMNYSSKLVLPIWGECATCKDEMHSGRIGFSAVGWMYVRFPLSKCKSHMRKSELQLCWIIDTVFHLYVTLDFKLLLLSAVDSSLRSASLLLYVLHFSGFPVSVSVLYQCEVCGKA